MPRLQSAKLILLIATALLVASCASSRVVPPVEGCSSLAAPILGRVTPHAEIGDSGDPALDWQLYGTAETGQLNSANSDKKIGLEIIRGCEARDAQAFRKINAPWYAFWI
jgi:hypothetical protein